MIYSVGLYDLPSYMIYCDSLHHLPAYMIIYILLVSSYYTTCLKESPHGSLGLGYTGWSENHKEMNCDQ